MQRLGLVLFSLVALLVVVGAAGLFVVDAETDGHDPADFDRTVQMGITMADEFAYGEDVEYPRVQVFYSQYQYVVGYYGVEMFLETQREDRHAQRFGYPLTIHVSDYSGADVELTEDGHPATDDFVGWTDAEAATYVVGSDARGTHGETVVPFSDRSDAEAFADEYGGEILTWEGVLELRFEIDDANVVRDRVGEYHDRADELVGDSRELLDRSERPVSVTVGEDTATIQEAIDQAPENTTVLVPEGTYEERVEINRSITLAGENATIDGEGEGTVVKISDDDVAVTGFEVVGTGDIDTGRDRDDHADDIEDEEDEMEAEWDEAVEDYYGVGDAGVAAIEVSDPLIEDVEIETQANGVLLRDSPGSVVRDITVIGTEEPYDGFMGVVAMRSPSVIEESTFIQGRDGVYTHRSDGIIIRDNEARDLRYGIHLMYTSDSLIADNHVENPDNAGVTVMTTPQRNAIVGNHLEGGNFGLWLLGSHFYVADNTAVDNDVATRDAVSNTIYEGNVFANAELGFQSASILPADRVVDNDFVGNDVHATADEGPLRVFTHEGVGNYWEGAIGTPSEGTLNRPYTATDPVDKRLHYVDGTPTLAQSPAVTAIGGLEAAVPALRDGTVIDSAPLCEPSNPDELERIDWDGHVRDCS